MYRKLTKKEINKIADIIGRRVFISDKMYHEEFKQVETKYGYSKNLISSFGRVFKINLNNPYIGIKKVRPTYSKKGYEIISIDTGYGSKSFQVHRLVAFVFIKNDREDRTQVNHINGVKTDNYVWNLEWNTPKENVQHAWKTGLVNKYGINANHNNYNEYQIYTVCEMLQDNYRICDISRLTKVDSRLIYYVLAKHNWLHISNQYDFSKFGTKPKKKLEFV